tara:strand:+ start:3849 stop:3965 length:117 start_codon:yes stop_codon:yes gene_type:complete
VEWRKESFVLLAMPVGELSLMAIQLKSINAFFVIDENQ